MLATKASLRETTQEVQPQVRVRAPQGVRARQPMSRLDRASVFGCIAVAVFALWMLGTVGGRIDTANYQIVQLQAQVRQMAADNASLTAQDDALRRPSRVLAIAMDQLGMYYSDPVTITVPTTSP